MNAFNRGFVSLLMLAWCAALAGVIYLIWDQGRLLNVDTDHLKLSFDVILATRNGQIGATLIACALMLPALVVLVLEVAPRRRADVTRDPRYASLQERAQGLQDQLDEERRRSRPRPVETPAREEPQRRGVWRFLPH